ncbi:annexin A7/11 [Schistosoma bovis]|uniref:Annexin n=1 Tax=Schistosoma bovis TaxID=6184 RepID=A0A430QD54_SCHBO|nr:annexin A7/11 [Schistosoma bovis]
MPITGGIAAPKIIPLKSEDKETLQGCIDTQTFIEIVSDTPNARLYFTTNGKNPNPWKRKVDGREVTFVYKAPFALRPGKRVVKAIAVHSVTNVESHTVTRKFRVIDSGNKDKRLHNGDKPTGMESDEENLSSDALEMLDNYDDDDNDGVNGNADQGFAATNHSGTQINLWGQMPGLNWDIRTPNSSNISGSYPMLNNNTIPYWSTQPSINMENFVSPQQLSAIANHLTQVISADFDENEDSYLLTIHLDKPIKAKKPQRYSQDSGKKSNQNKSMGPPKTPTPNRPSSLNKENIPYSPEKRSQKDDNTEDTKSGSVDISTHDQYRDVEEYPLEPTLKPSANFDVDKDCEQLHQAMAGMGTNEKSLIEVMGHRSSEQRVTITQKYKSMYGKDLTSKFKSELSGSFYDCMEALCYSPVEFDARELRRSVKGAGTDEDALIEILCSRTNAQIKQIKETYSKIFPNRDLENDVKSDTSRHFKRVCIALLQGDRDESLKVDMELVRKDAENLYRAGEQKLGTDESRFVQILVSRSFAHLRLLFEEYSTIVSCIKNKPKYFAEKLEKSMKRLGTDNRTLIRIIVSRCEVDLGIIKKEFSSLTG